MSVSKSKPKDNSTNKFLQRIAGKKALVPPPTPRPVIGEHPVRTLMRENKDDDEAPKQEDLVKTETPLGAAAADSTPPAQQPTQVPLADAIAQSPSAKEVDGQKISVLKSSAEAREFSFTPKEVLDRGTSEKSVRPPRVSREASADRTKSEITVGRAVPAKNVENQLVSIKNRYRLNVGEFALYRELYLMTHAIGQTDCSFVVSELMKSTGMLERRVRDNIRRLKKNGWIILLEGYDFENREKAKYRVNIEPEV